MSGNLRYVIFSWYLNGVGCVVSIGKNFARCSKYTGVNPVALNNSAVIIALQRLGNLPPAAKKSPRSLSHLSVGDFTFTVNAIHSPSSQHPRL
jgi:hypothetical protein